MKIENEIRKAVESLTAGDKIQLELDKKNNCLKIWKLNLKKIEVKGGTKMKKIRTFNTMEQAKAYHNWFVANDNGDIAGHDMDEARARSLADILNTEDSDANWEALGGDIEVKDGIK